MCAVCSFVFIVLALCCPQLQFSIERKNTIEMKWKRLINRETHCIHGNSSTRNNNTCMACMARRCASHIHARTSIDRWMCVRTVWEYEYTTKWGVGIARMNSIGAYTRKLRAMLEKCTELTLNLYERSLYEFSSSWNVEDVGRILN